MNLVNIYWTPIVNMLQIECDCGNHFDYPANYSLVECPKCHYKEFWHVDASMFNEIYHTHYKTMINKIINI